MISALLVSTLFGAGPVSPAPDVGGLITEVRRAFIEDGSDRVSATPTHRVISHADGSLELQGGQPLKLWLQSITRSTSCQTTMLSRLTMLDGHHTVRSLRSCDVEESWTNSALGLEHAFTILRPPAGTGGFTLFVRVDGPWHHSDDEGHVFQGPGAGHSLRYGRAYVVRGAERTQIEVVHVEGGLELRVPASLADAPNAFPMEIDPVLSAEVPLDPALTFGPSPGQEETPAIAVNGNGTALVVWVDTRRQLGIDLYGARISSSGGLGDPVGIPITVSPNHQLRPTVCGDGANFLVAWDTPIDGGFQVRARQVTGGGVALAEFPVVNGYAPALAASDAGINFLAYVDLSRNAQVLPLYGMNVGVPVSRAFIPDEDATNPAIAASGRGWFAAWETPANGRTAIRGMRSNQAASPSVVPVFDNLADLPIRRPTVALTLTSNLDEDAIVMWGEGFSGAGGARLSASAATTYFSIDGGGSPALVRTSSAVGALPTLGTFVQGPRLLLRNLNDGGTTSVGIGPSPRDLVLAAGQQIFAAWTEVPRNTESNIHGAVFNGPTASPTLVVSRAVNSQRGPRVALSDTANEGLAVWLEGTTTIVGAKVVEDQYGLRVGSPFRLYESNQTIEELDVAALAVDPLFLVTWRMASAGIMGLLTATSPSGDAPFVISAANINAGPAVAWDEGAGSFVVAWNQTAGTAETVSRTVTPAGVMSGLRVHASGPARDLAISCMRSSCLLAWEKPAGDLSGLVIGPMGPTIFNQPFPAGNPTVAHDGTDFFLAWHSANGVSLGKVNAATGVLTSAGGIMTSATVTALSMASAVPPVLSWSELEPNERTMVFLQRIDLSAPAENVALGFNPSVAIGSINAQPRGVIVYQRYLGAGVNAMRAFGKAFTYVPDAGYLDAGLDAGIDAGTPDAGMDAGMNEADAGVDAGSDAGSMPGSDAGIDGGSNAGGPFMFETSGCGCQSGAGAPLFAMLALLALRRRREIGR